MTGAPLEALSLLFCKKCQQAYRLIDGHVDQGEVLNGIMTCSCGERLVIHEGIVYGEGALNSSEAFVFDDTFIEDYVQTTHIDYLKNLHLTLQWARKYSIFENPHKGSVLELGSGRGFFLRNMIEMIPKQSVYIAVDHNPNAHQWLKKDLANAGENLKILYLCCDFKTIPLQDHSIDYLIDATGSTNYAFEHSGFLLDSIMPLLKKTSIFQGHFLFFENFSLNTLIPKDRRKWFQKEGIQHELSKLGFKCMRNYETQLISEGGHHIIYFLYSSRYESLSLVQIYVSSFFLSVFTSFYDISMEAAKPNITYPESRIKVNSLSKLIDSASAILGPILGGVMIALVDIRLFILKIIDVKLRTKKCLYNM